MMLIVEDPTLKNRVRQVMQRRRELQLRLITSCLELMAILVCGKRSSLSGVGLLSSALILSLTVLLMILLLVCFDMIVLPCRTNLHLPDLPLVYASDAFFKLTETQIQTQLPAPRSLCFQGNPSRGNALPFISLCHL